MKNSYLVKTAKKTHKFSTEDARDSFIAAAIANGVDVAGWQLWVKTDGVSVFEGAL